MCCSQHDVAQHDSVSVMQRQQSQTLCAEAYDNGDRPIGQLFMVPSAFGRLGAPENRGLGRSSWNFDVGLQHQRRECENLYIPSL